MTRRLATIDLDTGELLEGVRVSAWRPRPSHPYGDRWLAMHQGIALRELARDLTLPRAGYAALLESLSVLDYNNYLAINISAWADSLGMSRRTTGLAVAALVERQALIAGTPIGCIGVYRLHPRLAWRGSVIDLKSSWDAEAAIADHMAKP